MLLLMLLNMIKGLRVLVVFTNKNEQIVDVTTLTSSSQLSVEHKGT